MKKIFLIPLHLLLMFLLAVGLVVGVLMWLDAYTLHDKGIAVPDVKNLSATDAVALLQSKQLNGIIADSSYVKEKPGGCVLDYNPPAGQPVKQGRSVYLIVNRQNVPEYPIPDVADNSSVRQAEAAILAAGFKLASHEYIAGEKDWVYGVRYKGTQLAPGAKVPQEAVLTLIVGNGNDPNALYNNSEFSDEENDAPNQPESDMPRL